MYILFDLGKTVERIVGSGSFILIYTLSGITGSAVSLFFHPTSISIGASGAVFGVAGCFFAAILTAGDRIPQAVKKSIRGSIGKFIMINVIIGVSIPIIDNSAHMGGLAAGFVAGLALTGQLFSAPVAWPARATRLILPILATALVSWGSLSVLEKRINSHFGFDYRIHDDLVAYSNALNKTGIETMEYEAALAYHDAMNGPESTNDLATILRDTILPLMDKERQLLSSLTPTTDQVKALYAQKVDLAQDLYDAYSGVLNADSDPADPMAIKKAVEAVDGAMKKRNEYIRTYNQLLDMYRLKDPSR
jgi:hypothetical protein